MAGPTSSTARDADDFLAYGLIGMLLTGLVGFVSYEDAAVVTLVVFGLSAVVLLIGIVAKGVEVGMRTHRAELRREVERAIDG